MEDLNIINTNKQHQTTTMATTMTGRNLILEELQRELETNIDWRSIPGRENRADILKRYRKWLSKEEIIELKRKINSQRASRKYRQRGDNADNRVRKEIWTLIGIRNQLIMEKWKLEQESKWFQNATW